MQNWELSVARIEYGTGSPATGWLCSQKGHLLTCGHIFADGNDDLPIDGVAGDGLSCVARFPGHGAIPATVVRYWCTKSKGVDFAVLQIAKEDLPDGVSPLKVGRLEGPCKVILYGYGEGQAHILSPESGEVIWFVRDNDDAREGERDHRADLLKVVCQKANVLGFSGSPAYCDDSGTVVAIQCGGGYKENPDKDCVYVMPISRAEELWKPLTELLVRGDPVDLINSMLIEERDSHPSFELMKDGFDKGLLPYSQIPNRSRDTKVDGGDVIRLSECIRRSWEGGRTHLFIEGKGGVGKTVALLTFATEEGLLPRDTAAVYIPLYTLSTYFDKGEDCIDEYVTKHFPENLAKKIGELSFASWDDGPNLILLLDGYNEVPPGKRGVVEWGITKWAKRSGTQIVATSRIPGLTKLAKTTRLELCELSEDAVIEHLESRGIRTPERGSRLMQLLRTPLMLRLYVSIMEHRQKGVGDAGQAEVEANASAGGLVRDYLKTELELHMEHIRLEPQEEQKRLAAERTCIEALLLTLPYMCWRMESAHEYEIDGTRLSEYIRDAIERWQDREPPTSVVEAKEGIRPGTAIAIDRATVAFDQRSVLKEAAGLVLKREDKYVLAHQSLRDGMAAIHLLNAAESSPDPLPDEFRSPISEPVKDHFTDVIGQYLLLKLWDANRRTRPTDVISTDNLLRVIYQSADGNLERLNWSGMDLRDTNLYRFRKDMRLELSRNPKDFEETRIQLDCFLPLGHCGVITSVCFSPDGSTLASGSWDGTVFLWDTGTGLPMGLPLKGHEERVTSVCFSPDGLVASGSLDGTVRLWNPSSGLPEGQPLWGHGGGAASVCFSPDGSLLASGTWDGAVILWDPSTGLPKGRPLGGHQGWVTSVCFSPDGSTLASGCSDGIVRLWDTETGLPKGELLGSRGVRVSSVWFSPDGSTLASSAPDRIVRLWDPTTGLYKDGRVLRRYGRGEITNICLSPDGSMLASGDDDGTICIWDTATGSLKAKPLKGNWGWVDSVSFSPDGLTLASGCSDGIVRLWDPSSGLPKGQLLEGSFEPQIESACLSLDGSTLAVVFSDGTIRLWEPSSGLPKGRLLEKFCRYKVKSACFSPDGSLLALGFADGNVYLWDVGENKPKGRPLEGNYGQVESVSFSSDGSTLASGTSDRIVRLWDPASGLSKCEPLRYRGGDISSVCLSPNGTLLAVGTRDGAVCLWDVDADQPKGGPLENNRDRVESVSFSPDGLTLAIGYRDGSVYLWDVDADQPKGGPLENKGGWVGSVSFSPDGLTLAIGYRDGSVRLWDIETQTAKSKPLCISHEPIKIISYSHPSSYTPVPNGKSLCAPRDVITCISYPSFGFFAPEPVGSSVYISSVLLTSPHILSPINTKELSEMPRQMHIEILHNIDISELDFTLTRMDERTRKVLRQNGAKA